VRRHQFSKRRPPKIQSPISKPSTTVVPAPSAVGFASRHVLRCSSDRKKLIVVHSESKALHCSSTRFPNQSMMPSASGPGPCGVTENLRGEPQWWQPERMSIDRPIIGAMASASVAQQAYRSLPSGSRTTNGVDEAEKG